MAFHRKRFSQILLLVFMCSPLHKIASSLYYKRLMVRGVNAYLNLRGNEIGSLAYDGVHIFPLPLCVCTCILNSHNLEHMRREMIRPRQLAPFCFII